MADPIRAEAIISGVDVYRAQALVRRTARLELPAGASEAAFRLGGLSWWLEDDSVRVRIVEGAGRIADLHVELDVAERGGALRTAVEEKLRAHEREKVALGVERARHAALVRFVEGISPADAGGEPLPDEIACRERHPGRAALELAGFSRERALPARERIRAIDRALRELEDRLEAARDELARQDAVERERLRAVRKAARIRVEAADGARVLQLELSYLVPGAAWIPEYVLRVSEGRDEAELTVHAIVGQATGEAWPPVPLAFSTADLSRSTELPRLDSWRIGRAQPPRRSGWRELPDTVGELLSDYDRARPPSVGAPAPPELPPLPRTPRIERIVEREGEEPRARGAPAAHKKVAPTPPPPPSSAPSPIGFASMPAAAAMMPPPPPAPMRRMAKLAESEEIERSASMDYAEDLAAPEPPYDEYAREAAEPSGVAASRSALGYGRLRMQGPSAQSERGQLKAASLLDELRDGGGGAVDWESIAAEPPCVELDVPGGVPPDASAGHFAARFVAGARIGIPSDGGGHQVALARRTGPVERILACAPGSGPEVYELITFRNPLDVPLLAGPARVFRGGDFVAQVRLVPRAPGQPFTVNLGVEPGVVVARNVQFQESTGGLLGGATVLTHRIELELRSRLPRPAKVRVLERVPVSDDPEVRVELKRSTVKAEPYDQADRGQLVRGGLSMELELGPGEKKSCVLEYQVTIPGKKALVGGNRRE